MLIVALSIAIANPAAPEPLDFVFTPPAGTTFVAPQTGPGAWCSRAYVVDEGGACVEGEIGGVHARIVLEAIEDGGGPSFGGDGGEGPCSGLATLHSFHAAYADGREMCAVDAFCDPESVHGGDCHAPFDGTRVWYRSFEGRAVLATVTLDRAPASTWQDALAIVRKALLAIHARDKHRYITRDLIVPMPKSASVYVGAHSLDDFAGHHITWSDGDGGKAGWSRTLTTSSGKHVFVECDRFAIGGGEVNESEAQSQATCARWLDGVTAR